MRKYFYLVSLIVLQSVIGQDYAVANISEDLIKDADVVVRLHEGTFRILSIDKAEYKVKSAVTIMREAAKTWGDFAAGYDKLTSLTDVEIAVYDKNGKRSRKIKSSEINDQSWVSGFSIYEDNRVKWVDIEENGYPYTVEYSYTMKFKFLYVIPDWTFFPGNDVSVESSLFTLEYPIEIGARYKEQNFNGEKSESENSGIKTITWTEVNLPVIEHEKYGTPLSEQVSMLHLAPAKFSFEGYEGDMSTWDGFAAWIRKLNKDLEPIPQQLAQDLRQLTDAMEPREKVRAVYEYLQENTRYVSIQLGIGGFQPFSPAIVNETGYGDCKALSFFTRNMLSEVGISSNYTLVSAGRNFDKIDHDFPNSNFNHVILGVPMENDTIWLECTNQTNPFGYQGSFTGDREVFMIHENGGAIVKTTNYPSEVNVQTMNVEVTVSKEGHAEVKQKAKYQGRTSSILSGLVNLGYDDQKKALQRKIDISTFEINEFEINRGETEAVELSTQLFVNKLMSKSGTRLFLQPNIMNKNYSVPLKYKERKSDVIVKYGYHEYDTVDFTLPNAFRVEAMFDPINIQSEFGEYQAQIQASEDGKFRYVRHFMQKTGIFDKSKYNDYLNFHKQIVRSDKRKIALVTGT